MTEMTYSLPVMESVKAAWQKVKGAKGTFWAIFGIFFIAEIIAAILSSIVLQPVFMVILYVLQILSTIALLYIGIRRAQDVPIHYTMVKEVLTIRTFLSTIGLYILQFFIFIPAILLTVLGYVALMYSQNQPSPALNVVAFILYFLAVILFIALSLRMWLGLGFILDKKQNPVDALKNSFKATKGNAWNLLGLAIVNMFILFVSIITIYIGLIWGLPWLLIIYGEVYKRLASRP